MHISTRLEDREHEGLFRELGFTGFPTLAFLDSDALLTAKHAGKREVEPLQQTAGKGLAYLALRAKATAGDKAAVQHLFITDLELKRFNFANGSLKYSAMRKDMGKPLRKKARQALVDVQYQELRRELSTKLRAGMEMNEYRKQYSALNDDFFAAGRLPSGRTGMSLLSSIMRDAGRAEDFDRYVRALEKYKSSYADQPGHARNVARFESNLAALRAK